MFERIINSQGYADDIVEHVTTYGVSAEKVIIEHSDDAVRALNNGITPKTINDLQKIGIEPSNYGRNRAIYSEERAQSIISLNKHIHAEFTDEEISVLKKKVIDYEQQLKSEGIKQNEIGPAVCGVYNKRSNKFTICINNPEGQTPQNAVTLIQDRIDNMPKEIEEGYVKTHGKGSHAEVYAVNEALSKDPYASVDDLLIYVNHTAKKDYDAIYDPFFTCPHCEYILDGFNIISNVEI